jgi:hypothetical protein
MIMYIAAIDITATTAIFIHTTCQTSYLPDCALFVPVALPLPVLCADVHACLQIPLPQQRPPYRPIQPRKHGPKRLALYYLLSDSPRIRMHPVPLCRLLFAKGQAIVLAYVLL